jgi:hypothetical protein
MQAGALVVVVLFCGGAFAQTITRSFGSVVFPGGTSATSPNITRNFGSVVFPGGSPSTPPVHSGPSIIPPPVYIRPASGFNGGNSFNRGGSLNIDNNFRRGGGGGRGSRTSPAVVYAYPVYVGGFGGYTDSGLAPLEAPEASAQPNVTVVYPQQQQEVRPIIIQVAPEGQYAPPARQRYTEPEPAAQAEPETPRYLIAFKDHTIYSAVAYWFDGDTLHYFTRGDTHNQVSMDLLDRDLTTRLNRELGIEFKLPAAK